MSSRSSILSTALIAVLLLSTVLVFIPVAPAYGQVKIISMDPSRGPVGTKVTITGTIVTYNGEFEIWFDCDADGQVDVRLKSGYAVGHDVKVTVTIPDAYGGSRLLELKDVAAGVVAKGFFIVDMAILLTVRPAIWYEGGPFYLNVTITGGSKAWIDHDGDDTKDVGIRFRIVDPTKTVITIPDTGPITVDETAYYGKFELSNYECSGDKFVKWGTYTVLLDVDKDDDTTWEDGELGLATTTFAVRLTDKPEYGRTESVRIRAYVTEAGTYYYKIYDPTGALVDSLDAGTGPGFLLEKSWKSAKNSPLGTYTVKVVKGTTEVKSQTFLLKAAALSIRFTSPTTNVPIERVQVAIATFYVEYPDGTRAGSLDIPKGFKVAVFYNKTKVTEITLDPLLNYNVTTETWFVSWKIPKSAVLGGGYAFNVTANAITDAYGNVGPTRYASSGEQVGFFEVRPATLIVTTPSLVYPAPAANLPRTLEARASIKVTYRDGSLFTSEDLKLFNVTIVNATTLESKYTISLTAADYNADLGLWIARWKIPYNAPLGGYAFRVLDRKVVDRFGNIGPENPTGKSSDFNVIRAVITITDFKTNLVAYETGETVYVTFEAFYPSGDKVTKGTATILTEPEALPKPPTAKYDAALGKWLATFIVPDDWLGKYNVTLDINALLDDAPQPNTGPTAKVWYSFSVVKITIIEVVVDVGSTYFPGETVTFFAIARLRGAPYDLPAAAFSAIVYRPDGVTVPLTAVKVAPGLYKFSYALPADAPVGGYVAAVKAEYEVAPYTYARGFGIVAFSVSPTLTETLPKLATKEDVSSAVATIQKAISDATASTVAAVKSIVDSATAKIGEAISNAVAAISAKVDSAVAAIQGSISAAVKAIGDKIAELAATISAKVEEFSKKAADAFADLGKKIDAVGTTVTKSATDLKAAIDGVGAKVDSAAKSLSDKVDGAVATLSKAVADVGKKVDGVTTSLTALSDTVKTTVVPGIGTVSSKVDKLSADVSSAIASLNTMVIATAVLVVITLIVAVVAAIRVRKA